MRSFTLAVKSRKETTKKSRREAIANRQVLGNVFGDGDSIAVQGNYREFSDTVKGAGKNHPVKLVVDDKNEFNVLIRDVENDVLTQRLHHVTFRVIRKGEKIKAEVPVHLLGEAPGVKAGLMVVHVLQTLNVETTPDNIPESLDYDISKLEEDGDAVRLSDIDIDKEVTVLEDENAVIAKIETPRAQLVEEEEEEVEGEEGEEGEGEGGDEGEDSTEGETEGEAKEQTEG